MEDKKTVDTVVIQTANQKDQKKEIVRPSKSVKAVVAGQEVLKPESSENKIHSGTPIKSQSKATVKSSASSKPKVIPSRKKSSEDLKVPSTVTVPGSGSSGSPVVEDETKAKIISSDEAASAKKTEADTKGQKEKSGSVMTPEEKIKLVKKNAKKAEKKVDKLKQKVKKAKKKDVKKSKLKSLKDKLVKAFKKLNRYNKELKK